MGRSRLSAAMRLGTVPFLNARPLTIALESEPRVELIVEPPSKLARMLAQGELEGALVSSFALFRTPGAGFVPGVGIASRGAVESIRLYCRRPADALRRVGLDSWSLAAANMARVYLRRRWGADPEFVPIDPLAPPREDEALDAFLLIGDNALREPPGAHYVLDLGEEWSDLTGLPFVYALWVFRQGAGDAESAALLRGAKEAGTARLEEILSGPLPPGVDEGAARRYLAERVRYDVGEEELEGLGRYYAFLVEDGLAPAGWEARRVGEPARRVEVREKAARTEDAAGGADEALCFSGVAALARAIRTKEVSPVEVAEAHLRRIEAVNPAVFAYQTVAGERAMEEARAAEAEIMKGGWRGALHGVPCAAKDIVDTAGVLTTNGSSFHRDNVPREDAEVVRRLGRAGAVLLGKTNTHEFAAASTTINPHYGATRNPWRADRIAGGSSGGSAAACAAGLAPMSIGTDTGGSIRNPAVLCGVVGLKPTHGRVSLRGVCPNVPGFDHAGPIARSVEDAALMLQAMAGYDPADSHSRDVPVPDFAAGLSDGVRGSRLLVCPDYHGGAEADAGVMAAFARAVEALRALGAAVEEVSFARHERLMALFPSIAGPEFAEFHRPFFEENPEGYGADVRERLEWSFRIPMADYARAARERVLLRREAARFLEGADALLQPAMPCAAPPIETLVARINGRGVPYAHVHRPFLSTHNATGFPAVVLPMGRDAEGMPLGLQIAGAPWREAAVLRVARAYEEATPELRGARPALAP